MTHRYSSTVLFLFALDCISYACIMPVVVSEWWGFWF